MAEVKLENKSYDSLGSCDDFSWETFGDLDWTTSTFNGLCLFVDEKVKTNEYMVSPFVIGVVSDIGLKNINLSEQDLDKITSKSGAMGLSDWQIYTDGEYKYREALFRLIIENKDPDNIGDIEVVKHKLSCDVFDVNKKGDVSINAEEVTVTFDEAFNMIPVVSANLTSVDGFGIIKITEIKTTHFKIKIEKSDGGSTFGNAVWIAQGC
ncbi:MAG: hypothetical protein GY760_00920 [Deltaproteobacteria bacterium]|nr:hypothetical protein [Deltaproteobacteria bacterium]